MAEATSDGLVANKKPRSVSVPRGPAPGDVPTRVKRGRRGGARQAAEAPEPAPTPEAVAPKTASVEAPDATQAATSTTTRRGRGRKPAAPPPPPKLDPLTPEELQALGQLMADAAALGQDVEDFVQDLRVQVQAFDRMKAIARG